jgi:hypothetical protein
MAEVEQEPGALARGRASSYLGADERVKAYMLRFLARALGLILIAAGFVGIVIDGTRSIANGTVMFTPLGEAAFRVFGERYLLLQPAIERHVHPVLWDPIVLNLTLLPGSVVAFLLGVVLLWLGQKRPEPIGFAPGR